MFQEQSVNKQGKTTETIDIRTWRAERTDSKRRQDAVHQQLLRRLHELSAFVN